MSDTRLLVVGAHAGDFVWRSGGAIALTTSTGGEALSVALSYGARGESGELWSQPGQTLENVVAVRHQEAMAAAEALGAEFRCLDFGDYPLVVDTPGLERLADIIRDFEPTVVITHAALDPLNPDHPVANAAALRGLLLATGAGRSAAFKVIPQPQVLMFEPHYPEPSDFVPDVYLDITPVDEVKDRAMRAFASQSYMREYQTSRSQARAWQARRIGADRTIELAEVYQRHTPQVIKGL